MCYQIGKDRISLKCKMNVFKRMVPTLGVPSNVAAGEGDVNPNIPQWSNGQTYDKIF